MRSDSGDEGSSSEASGDESPRDIPTFASNTSQSDSEEDKSAPEQSETEHWQTNDRVTKVTQWVTPYALEHPETVTQGLERYYGDRRTRESTLMKITPHVEGLLWLINRGYLTGAEQEEAKSLVQELKATLTHVLREAGEMQMREIERKHMLMEAVASAYEVTMSNNAKRVPTVEPDSANPNLSDGQSQSQDTSDLSDQSKDVSTHSDAAKDSKVSSTLPPKPLGFARILAHEYRLNDKSANQFRHSFELPKRPTGDSFVEERRHSVPSLSQINTSNSRSMSSDGHPKAQRWEDNAIKEILVPPRLSPTTPHVQPDESPTASQHENTTSLPVEDDHSPDTNSWLPSEQEIPPYLTEFEYPLDRLDILFASVIETEGQGNSGKFDFPKTPKHGDCEHEDLVRSYVPEYPKLPLESPNDATESRPGVSLGTGIEPTSERYQFEMEDSELSSTGGTRGSAISEVYRGEDLPKDEEDSSSLPQETLFYEGSGSPRVSPKFDGKHTFMGEDHLPGESEWYSGLANFCSDQLLAWVHFYSLIVALQYSLFYAVFSGFFKTIQKGLLRCNREIEHPFKAPIIRRVPEKSGRIVATHMFLFGFLLESFSAISLQRERSIWLEANGLTRITLIDYVRRDCVWGWVLGFNPTFALNVQESAEFLVQSVLSWLRKDMVFPIITGFIGSLLVAIGLSVRFN